MESKQELIGKMIELAEFLNREYHLRAIDGWRGVELSVPQIKTLILLDNIPRIRMGGIAQYLGSTLSASTSIIDRLVEKGLVRRGSEPGDRRVVVCQLTKRGRDTLNDFWNVGNSKIELIAHRLSEDQLASIVNALAIIQKEVEYLYETGEPLTLGDESEDER